MIKAVIFDADGVLIDSLVPHLQFSKAKNKEYHLNLNIPEPAAFKKLVNSGAKISPMKFFFTSIGFTETYAEKADAAYQADFSKLYLPHVFPGVEDMLSTLKKSGFILGIVTSNILDNISKPLGNCLDYFDRSLILSKDSPNYSTKTVALINIISILKLNPKEVLYVGDQFMDHEAAQAAGTSFLGVTYGWCFETSSLLDFPLVEQPIQIADFVLNQR